MTEDFNVETDLPDWVTGNLGDIKEEKNLIPPSQKVLVKVEDIVMNNLDKDGDERNWKWLKPNFKIIDGIEVGGETKYKGSLIFGDMLCYFANVEFYEKKDAAKSSGKPYAPMIKKGQHLIDLQKFCKACDVTDIKIDSVSGLSDESAAIICEKTKGMTLAINIGQKKDGDIMINTIAGFSKVLTEDLV